jgi:hypothetical protein
MEPEDPIQLLQQLRAEGDSIPRYTTSAEFITWQQRTRSALSKCLGEGHRITRAFVDLRWTPRVYNPGDDSGFIQAFWATMQRAQDIIDAALFELEQLRAYVDVVEGGGVDPELWKYVRGHVWTEEWGKVASQSSIYTEDRIRRWAGRPAGEVGEKLMSAVFGDKGDYRLGLTESEKQGWHRFAMGTAMALRNVDGHHLQSRPDHKVYAMGVLGANSLLLTQMRFEHGNRFHDMTRGEPPDPGRPA